MEKCSLCHARKGKRGCERFGGRVCSLCCGTHQHPAECPACQYLPVFFLNRRYTKETLQDAVGTGLPTHLAVFLRVMKKPVPPASRVSETDRLALNALSEVLAVAETIELRRHGDASYQVFVRDEFFFLTDPSL